MKRTCLLVIALAWLAPLAAKEYTTADLEALAAKQSWTELVDHLKDIAPSARDAKWEKLVETAYDHYLDATTEGNNRSETALKLLSQYPFLKTSPSILQKRRTLGIAWFENCLGPIKYGKKGTAKECFERFLTFVKEVPTESELALAAGRTAYQRHAGSGHEAAEAVPFFYEAFQNGAKDKVCADAGARQAIVVAMQMEEGPPVEPARKMAGDACWAHLKDQIEKLFDMGMGKGYLASACPLMRSHGMLRGLRESRCSKF